MRTLGFINRVIPKAVTDTSVTVSVPAINRFDPEALQRLIERSRNEDYDYAATQ